MSEITGILAREILDSRGNPTVEVEVRLETGAIRPGCRPLRSFDWNAERLWNSETPQQAIWRQGCTARRWRMSTNITPALLGFESSQQVLIDSTMLALDGTANKENLGANAILGVSMAVAKATAMELEMPLYNYLGGVNAKVLPVPMMNILNGGAHADNNVDIQEFMILPAGAQSFAEALRMGTETFHALKAVLKKKGLQTAGGDEGGFAPNLRSNEEAMESILEGIVQAGYSPGKDIFIGIDAAASEFYSAEEKCMF
jgi:enolase